MHDRRFLSITLLLAAAVLLLPVAGYAQSFNGSVSGTIVDPSGSPVPGTSLVLKNTGTGVELRRTSETSGSYAFRNLVPGTYDLSRGPSPASSPSPAAASWSPRTVTSAST